jgi:ABC-type branched-subunit amino acid transport system ATPase component
MTMLEGRDICSGYGDTEVLHGVSITVKEGEIITIIGPNGAGKSTLLKTIMGYLLPSQGRILFRNEEVTRLRPDEKVRKGIGYVPQLENVFSSLTVEENLEMGGYIEDRKRLSERMEDSYALFPLLKTRRTQRVRTMSGGERQMLAMARALMTQPSLLLLDEPSAGLSPKVSAAVFENIERIHQQGKTIIIVEQDAYQSLEISDRGYVLAMGQNEYDDEAHKILDSRRIREAYLGG